VVVRDRHVQCRNTHRRRIQLEETFFIDDRHHLGAHTYCRLGLFGDYRTMGLADGVADARAIQRVEREQVDHLGLDTVMP
jgi:hypothetical protein